MTSPSTLHTSHSRSSRLPWLLLISLAVIALDRWSKDWIKAHIELAQAIPVIPRFFRLTHVLNDGAAFSLFADSASPEHVRWGLIAFSTAAALAVLIALMKMGRRFTPTTVAPCSWQAAITAARASGAGWTGIAGRADCALHYRQGFYADDRRAGAGAGRGDRQ